MSSRRIELVASATQTATGQSAAVAVPTLSMAMVGLDITAENATDVDFWLEGSDDGGTTWYPLCHDWASKDDNTEVAGPNVMIAETVAAVAKYMALYRHLACDYVRLAWAFNTATDITFSSSLVGK